MKLKPIINSLLETDAYKFNMQNIVRHKYSGDQVVWAFRCRNSDVVFTPEMRREIREQIAHYCTLRFTKEELEWLAANFPWLGRDYIDFLRLWHPWEDQITIDAPSHIAYNNCGLTIEARGTWLDTMMYEIAILAIVNEVYFASRFGVGELNDEFKVRSLEKMDALSSGMRRLGTFSEFGMRRRYSADMQDWLVGELAKRGNIGFVGTSNVYLAKKYGVKAVGTQAHEFFMAYQGKFHLNPAYSNRFALQDWVEEYKTLLGIALTDTLGTDVFLKDFDLTYATLFNGVRHDSGDPIEWGEKMITHYEKLGIDPKTKTLLFSDSLNLDKADMLYRHFASRAKVAFGIGTDWTCPFPVDGKTHPLNIVMKMVECNGSPVAKISNTPSKGMCRDEKYVEYLRRCIDWRMAH